MLLFKQVFTIFKVRCSIVNIFFGLGMLQSSEGAFPGKEGGMQMLAGSVMSREPQGARIYFAKRELS
jgi:hypothetical protein